jgi:hypothetical protein
MRLHGYLLTCCTADGTAFQAMAKMHQDSLKVMQESQQKTLEFMQNIGGSHRGRSRSPEAERPHRKDGDASYRDRIEFPNLRRDSAYQAQAPGFNYSRLQADNARLTRSDSTAWHDGRCLRGFGTVRLTGC